MLPEILGPIFCDEEKKSWDLYRIVKTWVEIKDTKVKRIVSPIIEWLLWSCLKVRNEYTSALETEMIVVTLPSQKLKA